MVQELLSQIRKQMEKTLEHFEGEVAHVRTGRAQASLVESIQVTYYGAQTPLKQLATVQVPDATTITIQPWDPKALADIEQAIRESDLGLQPTNDGRQVRLSIPPLTTERRTELVKVLHKMGEDGRVELRGIRKNCWEDVQKKQKDAQITEDEKYYAEAQLNKIIDEFNAEIDRIVKQKETDVLKV